MELATAARRITGALDRTSRMLVTADARELTQRLGKVEVELTRAYSFFDTFMDVLTQRLSPELGPLLKGCDVIARDGLRRPHPALEGVERPLVYLNRGFGAAVVREGVPMPGGAQNPLPLVQIPYARLHEKYNLSSLLHEVGHEALVRLQLRQPLSNAFAKALAVAGAGEETELLFASWTSEIFPDFWAFCTTGAAHAGTLRDVLGLPSADVLRLTLGDPHPVPYVRALLGFDWCRRAFGAGRWDRWEREWIGSYPLSDLAPGVRSQIERCRDAIPVVSRVLFTHHFPSLGGTIGTLFDLDAVAPARFASLLGSNRIDSRAFRRLRPATQLAAFRFLRESSNVGDADLNRTMTSWLHDLGRFATVPAPKRERDTCKSTSFN